MKIKILCLLVMGVCILSDKTINCAAPRVRHGRRVPPMAQMQRRVHVPARAAVPAVAPQETGPAGLDRMIETQAQLNREKDEIDAKIRANSAELERLLETRVATRQQEMAQGEAIFSS